MKSDRLKAGGFNPKYGNETGAITATANVTVVNPSVSIVKKTNDDFPSPVILHQGTLASWIYVVTNTGDTALTSVDVTDSDIQVSVACPFTALAAGESMTCFGYAPARLGPYSNTGHVTATPPVLPVVTASEDSSYTGINPTKIGNFVWLDENGNGIQDAGEPGIANQKVELKDGSGATVLATQYTDANGGYLFNVDLQSEGNVTYQVVVTPTSGLNPAYNEDTGTTTPDHQTTVTVAPGVVHLTADFGYNWVAPTDSTAPAPSTTGALGDRIWNDANGNGLQDPSESGIKNVQVALTGAGADGIFGNGDDPAPVTRSTDAAGNYIFDGLPPGVYRVTVNPSTLPSGITWTQTGDPDGAVKDNQTTTPVVLAPGDVYVNADFGYQPHQGSSIGDTLWFDANGDKAQEIGEAGIAGVTVALRDSNGEVIATLLTNATGQYLFPGLPAGTYTVVVTDTGNLLGLLEQSYDPDATLDNKSTVTVDGTTHELGQDFGYTPFGEHKNFDEDDGVIGDTIYLDRDGNGSFDAGEGLGGVTVRLYDSSGMILRAYTATSANGVYSFGRLDINSVYVVKVDTATLPNGGTGLTNTKDPDTASPGDSQATVPALSGTQGINLDQDFGYRALSSPASLGGTVWIDANANGTLDSGEAASILPNITVALRSSTGQLIATTLTDSSGNYAFSGLPAGSYSVAVTDDANLLEGWWHSLGNQDQAVDQHSKADPFTVTLAAGATNAHIDFGYYHQGAALGNRVWDDADGNGLQDAAESGLGGVLVRLVITYPNTATSTLATTTDSTGYYHFGNLLLDESFNGSGTTPGYSINLPTPPTGYVASLIGAGGNSLTDSNNPAGTTATVLKGQINTILQASPANEPDNAGYDFGYSGTATVTGHLYIDTNGNGSQDSGEPNLANVAVVITDRNGVPHTVQSGADGNYSASGIPAGSASVNVDESGANFPAGYLHNGSGEDPSSITVPSSGTVNAGDDGYQPPPGALGTVTGHLYIDTNNDGTQNPGEPNLANVSVNLTDINGGAYTAVSGSDGHYGFTGVPAGLATVNVDDADPDIPSGYLHNGSTSPAGDADPSTVLVAGGATTDAGKDGYRPPAGQLGAVTGRLYIDANGNGRQDSGEPGLADVDIVITDINGGTHTVTSDSSGDYSAVGIPAGVASVKVDASDPQYPAGYSQTEGSDPTVVTVPAGGTINAGNDGYHPPVGVIGNRVWLDENGDGVQDAGEAGIPDLVVELRSADGASLIASTTTDAHGGYLFANVPAGAGYGIRVIPAAGLNPTYDKDGTGTASISQTPTISAGADYLDLDFGYNWVPPADTTAPNGSTTGAIGDRVWNDANGDGVQDPGEAGIGGVTVRLLVDTNLDGVYGGAGDDPAVQTTTDAAGRYVFDGIAPNAYRVEVDSATLPAGSGLSWIQTGDPDGYQDHRTTRALILAPGDVYVNADFGYQPNQGSTIGDRIYLDANGNGADDGAASEPGMAGVSVALYDSTGTHVIATTLTDANGNYLFPRLTAGHYRVAVTDTLNVLGNYLQTGDPDSPATPDGYSTVTVNGTANRLDQDFGYAASVHPLGTGLLGDTIFLDRDGSGGFTSGEGLQGVSVKLYAADGATWLATTVTNANGQYVFDSLTAAATYVVKIDTTTLPNGGAGLGNTVDPDSNTANESVVDLSASGGISLTQDFGYAMPGAANTISGSLWNDANADGTLSAGESGRLAGVTVELLDSQGHVVGVTTTDSNADANFIFTGLPDGNYTVHITDSSGRLNGWWKSDGPSDGSDSNSQSTPYAVNVTGGTSNTTADFGYYIQGAALGNRIWSDVNGNGLQDSGELGIANVRISLEITYPLGGSTAVVTHSEGSGHYDFGNLLLDEQFNGESTGTPTYSISVSGPAGYTASPQNAAGSTRLTDSDNPAGTSASVLRGQIDTSLLSDPALEPANASYDFGYQGTTTLAGTVFRDNGANHGTAVDGIQNGNEPDAQLAELDPMYVVILDSNGYVLAMVEVCPSTGFLDFATLCSKKGQWQAIVPAGTGYQAYLTRNLPSLLDGRPATTQSPPLGWMYTNENLNSGSPSGAGDGRVTDIETGDGSNRVNFGIIRAQCSLPNP